MEPSELNKYEEKLLSLIKNRNWDKELIPQAYKIINHQKLEQLLHSTAEITILEAFAYEFLNEVSSNVHLPEEVAKNEHTPHVILDKLAQWGLYIGLAVANNTSTSTVTLLWIQKYSDDYDMVVSSERQLRARNVVLHDNGEVEEF